MTDESLRDDLAFAVEVARSAGCVALERFRTGLVPELKDDASPVTEADREAESAAREMIGRRHPGDAILGEELGETGAGARRRWIIDPIDGTRSFVRGVPLWGVLVALEEARTPIIGVIRLPALDETVYAARGLGCWWNGKPARVSGVDRIEDALVCTTDVMACRRAGRGDSWERLASRCGLTRTWGDCYGYALVATGRAEAMLDPVMHPWDAAALYPVIREAGGVITDWEGGDSPASGHVVATNGALAARVRALLRDGS